MKFDHLLIRIVICFLVAILFAYGLSQTATADEVSQNVRMPKDTYPTLGCWFWVDGELESEGYKEFLDLAGRYGSYDYLTTSLRLSTLEITDRTIEQQIERAAAYARGYGIGLVMDLDVRLARLAFAKLYPQELQEMMCLREIVLQESGVVNQKIKPSVLVDHYTNRSLIKYVPVWGKVVRVYTYKRENDEEIEPDSIRDVTEKCHILEASNNVVQVGIPCSKQTLGRRACVLATFGYMTPAVFAPHLICFQRTIFQQYAQSGLAGACKDEWGFPPLYDGNPENNNFWYSTYQRERYKELTEGRDLVRDFLLMYLGEKGRESERQRAINYFLEMARIRHGEIEQDFYNATKETFGKAAIVATHPTWFPYPGMKEFKKNSLHWWIAKRDWAQTDEITPFCVRSSLAKKWGSPIWYNMYYSADLNDYHIELWSDVLGGGRVNFHPPYPGYSVAERRTMLYKNGLMRGNCRVRLLNFITESPLDCPVAVIFGQACAMNWAGESYADVGLKLAEAFWRMGYPADLIPSTEIGNPAMQISSDGYVQYGPQKYQAVVLYHPEFENADVGEFFQAAAAGGNTALYRMGAWKKNFDGQLVQGNDMLPATMATVPDLDGCVKKVKACLEQRGVNKQTPCSDWTEFYGYQTIRPPTKGSCLLIDGTKIFVCGKANVAGDLVQIEETEKGRKIKAEAIGVLGFRLAQDGMVEALAAGGLRYFQAGKFQLELETPIDIAMWRDQTGGWQGVIQDSTNIVLPQCLQKLTNNWQFLGLPESF